MATQPVPVELSAAREQFLALVADLRPDLHRYCSRLVGSAIDGEDVVQEALAKAFYALSLTPELPPLRQWLFKIAHNVAVDFLRRYERNFVEPVAELPESAVAANESHPEVLRVALSSFVALPVSQRSAVILKDVLGHTLEDIAELTGSTVMAVKASLSRGRSNLRARGRPDVTAWRDQPETSDTDRALIARYVRLFNDQDWEGLKAMLLDECRLDLVSKTQRQGKTVGGYFARLAQEKDLRAELGTVESRAAIGVYRMRAGEPQPTYGVPEYFITLEFREQRVALIRDYRYVSYLASAVDFKRSP